jgi:hypothetical protein
LRYYSKRDRFYAVMIWGTALFTLYVLVQMLAAREPMEPLAVLVLLSILIFLLSMWFGTYYVFREEDILARSGWIRDRYRYGDITEIRRSRSLYSSLALSRQRMAVYIRGRLKGYISPLDERGFLLELKNHVDISQFSITAEVLPELSEVQNFTDQV